MAAELATAMRARRETMENCMVDFVDWRGVGDRYVFVSERWNLDSSMQMKSGLRPSILIAVLPRYQVHFQARALIK
jgi:hypothetical protein